MYLKNATQRAELADRLNELKPINRGDVDINTDVEFIEGDPR